MPVNFAMSSALAQMNGVKVLTYGGAGIGKTALCATAPRPLIISNESGMLSLAIKNLVRIYGEGRPDITYNIPVMEVKSIGDLMDAYRWCTQSAEAKNFDTYCLDSLSELSEVILADAKAKVKDPRQAYGEVIVQTEGMVRAFRDIVGKNVYMTSKVEASKDEVSGMVTWGPSMPGTKLGPKLPYLFDEVFELLMLRQTDGKSVRGLRTSPDAQHVAKDRSGALAEFEEPHLGKLFDKITGG